MRRDDEDDYAGEAGRAGGSSWIDRIVIPDDISELDAEVRALRRERRARRRRQRLRRLTGSPRTTGPLLMVAVLLIAGVAGLLVLFQPRRTPGTVATIGGNAQSTDRRLPDVLVRLVDGTSRRVREFRPAVLVLAPVGCKCDAALRSAGTTAHRHNVQFLMVDRTLPSLPSGLTEPSTVRVVEPTGTIARAYKAEVAGRRVAGGPVLVLVGQNGDVVRVLPETAALDSELTALVPQAAPAD